MSKGPSEQVTRNELDPSTQRYRDEIFNRARDVSHQTYNPYLGQRVAGIDPLSRTGANTLQGASNQLGLLGQMSMNQSEVANMRSNELNNLGSQYGRVAQETGGLAGQFDQYGRQMNQWAGSADQRAAGLDRFGDQFGAYSQTGNVGARALGGDPNATQSLMNPYQQQVLDAVGADFDRQRAQAHTDANQAATAAGAFGGSRHAVMEGARKGELDAAQLGIMANLRQTGFNDAMGRAGQAANLGFGAGNMALQGVGAAQGERGLGLQAQQVGQNFNQLGMDARNLGLQYDNLGLGARGMGLDAQQLGLGALGQAQGAAQGQAGIGGQLFGMGDYFRNVGQQGLDTKYNDFLEQRDWNVRNLDILKGGLTGMPYGTTQRTPLHNDPWGQILGAGLTIGGFALGGPGGAYAGNQIGQRIG